MAGFVVWMGAHKRGKRVGIYINLHSGVWRLHPAPDDDLQVGKVGLPHLVGPHGLGVERICCIDHHIGRAGVQVVGLEKLVNAGFGDEVARFVGELHRQFPRRPFGLFQRQLDDLVMDVYRDPVPHPTGCGRPIFERLGSGTEVAVIPAIKGPARGNPAEAERM